MRRAFFFMAAFVCATSLFASIPRASMLDALPPIADSLSETRIRVSDVLAPFERPAETELTRALRQGYGDVSTTYASGLGRFLSVDPTWASADLATPQSWNRYSYVRNNPIGNTDPDGKICIPCAAVGALVAVSYESYRQVKSGEPVNNGRLLAAVGIGAAAGATVGAAAKAAPIVYNAVLANPASVATGTAIVGSVLGADMPQTPISKNSIIEGLAVSNHAWRKSGLGRGATEEVVAGVINGAKAAGTVIEEVGKGKFEGNAIRVYVHEGMKVAVDETRKIIMSIRPTDSKQFKLDP